MSVRAPASPRPAAARSGSVRSGSARPWERLARPAEQLLAQLFGPSIAPELLVLWLVELLACARLCYMLLCYGLSAETAAIGLRMHLANQALTLALGLSVASISAGLYSPDVYLRTRSLLLKTALGALLGLPLIWLVGRAAGIDLAGLSPAGIRLTLEVLGAWTLALFALRLAFGYAVRADLFSRRLLIVGADAAAVRLAAAVRARHDALFEIVAMVPAEAFAAMAPRRLRAARVSDVIVTAEAAARLAAPPLLRAQADGLRLHSDVAFWERHLRRLDVDQVGVEAPAASDDAGPASGKAASGTAAALRRTGDLLLALLLLLLTLPLLLLTALAVRLDSRGPVLYRQERVGLHGRCFTVLKFRSMRTDAEACGPAWAARRDPRVTRVGAFIRLTRIDELPQLVNVLRGEMSLIGPRPERPHFVDQLEQALPFYRDRARVKPGLTGWAQVNYPYGASVEDARAKLSYDLYYIKHRGLLLDLRILLATVQVVLFQRGAR
jgi:exopolysaccharide biosynthesis polyprenyl glycosylphosphotransferase